jgi:hypothetical protein
MGLRKNIEGLIPDGGPATVVNERVPEGNPVNGRFYIYLPKKGADASDEKELHSIDIGEIKTGSTDRSTDDGKEGVRFIEVKKPELMGAGTDRIYIAIVYSPDRRPVLVQEWDVTPDTLRLRRGPGEPRNYRQELVFWETNFPAGDYGDVSDAPTETLEFIKGEASAGAQIMYCNLGSELGREILKDTVTKEKIHPAVIPWPIQTESDEVLELSAPEVLEPSQTRVLVERE